MSRDLCQEENQEGRLSAPEVTMQGRNLRKLLLVTQHQAEVQDYTTKKPEDGAGPELETHAGPPGEGTAMHCRRSEASMLLC